MQQPFASITAAAESTLSRSLCRDVRLGEVTRLSDDERRNLLLRVRDLEGGSCHLNPQASTSAPALTGIADGLQQLQHQLEALGVGVDEACLEEIKAVIDAVENPGAFLSYVAIRVRTMCSGTDESFASSTSSLAVSDMH